MNVTGAHPDYGFGILVVLGLLAFAGICIAFATALQKSNDEHKPVRGCVLIVIAVLLGLYVLFSCVSCFINDVHEQDYERTHLTSPADKYDKAPKSE